MLGWTADYDSLVTLTQKKHHPRYIRHVHRRRRNEATYFTQNVVPRPIDPPNLFHCAPRLVVALGGATCSIDHCIDCPSALGVVQLPVSSYAPSTFYHAPFPSLMASLSIWLSSAVLVIDRNGTLPYPKICGFGVLAMMMHVLVLLVAIQKLASTSHVLMMIASGLFFFETGAFLLVVTFFRHEISATSQTERLRQHHYDDEFS